MEIDLSCFTPSKNITTCDDCTWSLCTSAALLCAMHLIVKSPEGAVFTHRNVQSFFPGWCWSMDRPEGRYISHFMCISTPKAVWNECLLSIHDSRYSEART